MDDTSRRMNMDDTRGFAGDEPRDQVDERTRQIRGEIADTRGEMSETIDAIQEKLKPGNIVANASERVKTAAADKVRELAGSAGETAQQAVDYTRDAAAGVVTTARENPIPLALIGVGAAWWLTARSRSSAPSFERHSGARDHAYGAGTPDAASVTRAVTRRTNQLQRAIEQNPLIVGAGALMLGAAFGLAIPETDVENDLMGETRDSVVGRARGLGRDATHQVQEAASTVADNVIKSTENLQH